MRESYTSEQSCTQSLVPEEKFLFHNHFTTLQALQPYLDSISCTATTKARKPFWMHSVVVEENSLDASENRLCIEAIALRCRRACMKQTLKNELQEHRGSRKLCISLHTLRAMRTNRKQCPMTSTWALQSPLLQNITSSNPRRKWQCEVHFFLEPRHVLQHRLLRFFILNSFRSVQLKCPSRLLDLCPQPVGPPHVNSSSRQARQ